MRSKTTLFGTCAVFLLTVAMSSRGNAAPTRLHTFIMPLQAQAQTKQPVQEFQGTVEKYGAKFILEDKASGARYQLDKQDKARQFIGKDVKVTGTLDPSTNTIEVSEIKAERGEE